ncbi:hypothetical protein MNBD_GAMMA09-2444 [hydrothermal vent metagenome]|uniref:Uncharacterized protein n=1 Tax=hydrothermal vent metagenome TaxID=652676 RepID=A0A3B0Y990_9ZZZZ
MKNKFIKKIIFFFALVLISDLTVSRDKSFDFNPYYNNLIDSYVLARLDRLGVSHNWAGKAELMRRLSLDLTGEVPDEQDRNNLADSSRMEMALYFMNKPEFIVTSQLIYADVFKYSKAFMFSRETQIAGLNDLVGRLHDGSIMYDVFARKVLMEPAFLSRFTSGVDRTTVAMELFLGYTPVTPYDFEFANMFNGYRLVDNKDRTYTWDGKCDNSETRNIEESCVANVSGMIGDSPVDAGNILVSLPSFAEYGATVLWRRYIGEDPDAVLPELTSALGRHFSDTGYDLRELTLLIVTSAAYAQSNKFRDDDLVL